MPLRSRTIAREVATALAVMALYFLVLLSPLHQAAGLQRDLAQLGYAELDGWSICTPLAAQNQTGKAPVVVKCAASGIGKNELAAATPANPTPVVMRTAVSVRYAPLDTPVPDDAGWGSGKARAPPFA